jgi:hypothetical protein
MSNWIALRGEVGDKWPPLDAPVLVITRNSGAITISSRYEINNGVGWNWVCAMTEQHPYDVVSHWMPLPEPPPPDPKDEAIRLAIDFIEHATYLRQARLATPEQMIFSEKLMAKASEYLPKMKAALKA